MNARIYGFCPHLTVRDGAEAIEFYTTAFGAVELQRECLLDGRVLHAELSVGPYRLMLSEPVDGTRPSWAYDDESRIMLTLEYDYPDCALERAVAAGAKVEATLDEPPGIQGGGVVRDVAGHRWAIVPRRVSSPSAPLPAPP